MAGIKTYDEEIKSDAEDFMQNYEEELNKYIEDGLREERDSDDIFDEIEQTFNLQDKVIEWVDISFYSFIKKDFLDDCKSELTSYAKIIDECKQEETDRGLWEGQQPEESIKIKAFYSVINDFRNKVEFLIKEKINNYLKVKIL